MTQKYTNKFGYDVHNMQEPQTHDFSLDTCLEPKLQEYTDEILAPVIPNHDALFSDPDFVQKMILSTEKDTAKILN